MDAVTQTPAPKNEPVLTYAPGSAERAELEGALKKLGQAGPVDLTVTVGGEQRAGGGEKIDVVQPHNHGHVLGTIQSATKQDATDAIAAAAKAAPEWRALSYDDRAAILLRAADLLSGPWRSTLNAATMLGQSKTATQAEIDSACELADFWRFNVAFGRSILDQQPVSSPGVWNRMEHRPLEGFVYAITPFNFTAIAGNLPTAPALMGNTVLWKPSPTQSFAAHLTMRLLEEAGMPPGVINLLPGDGKAVSEVALTHRDLAGIHFTGSTATFQHLWGTVGANIAGYRSYPRLVGETGGKDFVLAHPSADIDVLRTALVRGSFEYQGQKCSAASRAYVPRSVWEQVKDGLASETAALSYGDVTDLSHFGGAVIDRRAFDKHASLFERVKNDSEVEILVGGTADDSVGYFVQPTVLVSTNPKHEIFSTEYFGPILSVYVYEDADFDSVLQLVDETASYALTGAVIANDRTAVAKASQALRFAAGNFYVNDKPTGAVVGQQPFGGARASGTNDKAGSVFNLLRWTSPRSIKETFVPPTSVRYPHQG
ncbi:L-glutamate gamma-semialdehyde dehydrogenase [Amycolatopsis rubida]|uniref:L-glutamate gamma-semialdehyde dehydrogenase n=1 Tax=Amycolatopsis rubida TaxID=112413 RepID=A0A1I5QK47_9PSEU|nr:MULTISPECIES: L-glutamate gamma-semialdehyde dehydrogenase [Amycolatopsis]MYW96594.1 L-glutamate gamma-semialdehyde dehydrogenase [Amycolatopsis rubida]NEC61579.1 L-glutamate gamma-semialdehyde dehydrogenase [Amycolatopsis rubida]OAP26582.1 1-pyrroline-5-carboxylate dehydrogenase [Amycolatopsis sp. M39]SFP46595.1 delta-1-pyrroline-5-carboxylate dehydrogenase [Amycolatopsis rubida]